MNPIVEKVYQIGIIPVIAFNSVDAVSYTHLISRLLHPPRAGLCAAGHCRRQAADAADMAAHSGRLVQRAAPRCQDPSGRLYRAVHPGTVCGHPVLLDAVCGGAAELRPLCGAGDRAQDHLLSKKTSHKPCGSFLSPNVNIVQFGFCPLQTILLQALFPSMLPVRLCRAGSL